MKKQLLLIRHAKSSWDDPYLDDRDRPLNDRGLQQLSVMAGPLAHLGAFDGPVFVSTAARARETFEGLADHLPGRDLVRHVRYQHALYSFSHKDLLTWLKKHGGDYPQITLVGHNPALLDLARYLAPDAPDALPTCTMIHLTLATDSWSKLKKHCGKVKAQLTPAVADYGQFQRKAPVVCDDHQAPLHKRLPKALASRYQLIRALEPGVAAGFDPEFLHQYRINLRSSRAIVESLEEITCDRDLKRPLATLKHWARATSTLRDLDVFLLSLQQWIRQDRELQPETRQALAQAGAATWFGDWQHREHQNLCRAIHGKDYQQDMQHWLNWLVSEDFRQRLKTIDASAIRDTLVPRINRYNSELAALTADSPDDDLHRLRKALKRIRYLTELDATASAVLLKELKKRQKAYGNFQDLCVQIDLLTRFLAADATRPITPDHRAAIVALIARLEDQKQEVRAGLLGLRALPAPFGG